MATFSIALIAVLHASDFIAGEHSRGMLTLLVSKPLHRWELIVGKYISFMTIFLPLLTLSIFLMAASIDIIGIGTVNLGVLGGYIFAVLFYGIVFTSIATLFSVLSKRPAVASLGALIFLILWMIFDFMNLYLPKTTADFLNTFSLSHYINKVLGFISNGQAGIFVTGGTLEDPGIEIFLTSLFAILIILSLIPVLLSIIILQKIDIKNR
jgi:ABC-type transport system involved in multi-copper enzyme maturation permease subunit